MTLSLLIPAVCGDISHEGPHPLLEELNWQQGDTHLVACYDETLVSGKRELLPCCLWDDDLPSFVDRCHSPDVLALRGWRNHAETLERFGLDQTVYGDAVHLGKLLAFLNIGNGGAAFPFAV